VFKQSGHDPPNSEAGLDDMWCKFLLTDIDSFLRELQVFLIEGVMVRPDVELYLRLLL
jgi:hypothetical protein